MEAGLLTRAAVNAAIAALVAAQECAIRAAAQAKEVRRSISERDPAII